MKKEIGFEVVNGYLFMEVPVKNMFASIRAAQSRATKAVKKKYPEADRIDVYGYMRSKESYKGNSYFYKYGLYTKN